MSNITATDLDMIPSNDRGSLATVAFDFAGRSYRASRYTRNGHCSCTELYLVVRGMETFLRYATGSWELDVRANHLAKQAEAGAADRPLELS